MGRDPMTGMETRHVRPGGAIGVRWVIQALLLALIAIAAVAGIVSTAAAGQTQLAIIIGVVSLAFFSRIGC
ncbi:MAG: hypothetical protein QOD39_2309 [Mycobacterium sp.]|nr:hypothetical protein [Mycobacterium sp.]